MGQYYKFMNIDKKQNCQRNWHGVKLMEHSYVGNNYCDDILRLLSNEWKGDRVIHVGDYAEPKDGTTTQNIIEKIMNENDIKYSLYSLCDQFDEVVIKIGQVLEAEKIEKSDKLLKLQVDIGEDEPRQIVAGLAKFYSPEELVDRKVCVVANLQPAKLFGTLSQGMILATGESGALLSPDENGKVGERIQ